MNDKYPASTPEYWMRRLQDGREEWRCLENTLSDLRSELAALREDKAILEWFIKHFDHANGRDVSLNRWLDGSTQIYVKGECFEGKTLRDATRAAMKGDAKHACLSPLHMDDEVSDVAHHPDVL